MDGMLCKVDVKDGEGDWTEYGEAGVCADYAKGTIGVK